jgi:hypothetical protein
VCLVLSDVVWYVWCCAEWTRQHRHSTLWCPKLHGQSNGWWAGKTTMGSATSPMQLPCIVTAGPSMPPGKVCYVWAVDLHDKQTSHRSTPQESTAAQGQAGRPQQNTEEAPLWGQVSCSAQNGHACMSSLSLLVALHTSQAGAQGHQHAGVYGVPVKVRYGGCRGSNPLVKHPGQTSGVMSLVEIVPHPPPLSPPYL